MKIRDQWVALLTDRFEAADDETRRRLLRHDRDAIKASRGELRLSPTFLNKATFARLAQAILALEEDTDAVLGIGSDLKWQIAKAYGRVLTRYNDRKGGGR